MSRAGLTFKQFRDANLARCREVFHDLDEWSETDWACAVAGEVGELCNLIKKRRRGEDVGMGRVADEIGDVVAYLDLLAARLGLPLDRCAANKFHDVSVRVGWPKRMRDFAPEGGAA